MIQRVFAVPQRHAFAVGVPFLTMSLLFASWIARLAEVQARLGLTEGQLGLALLGASAGAFVAAPLAGRLLRFLPAGKATLYSTIVFCGVIVLPALAWDRWSLTGGLFLVGLVNGLMNISMNAAVSAVEEHFRLSIMSACHGMFSLGGVLGAASAGFVAGWGVSLPVHLAGLGLLLILFNLAHGPLLRQISGGRSHSGGGFQLPRGAAVWGLVLIGFCVMIGEGAVADWSAIYLRRYLESGPVLAGLGYAGFSLAMAAGRFTGDRLRLRWGARRLVAGGSTLGAAGLLLAILLPYPVVAVAGFTLVGAGFSIIVPILYSEAARLPGQSPEVGIAAVASSGIIGFLFGPPFIGLLADHLGLAAGLGLVAVLALVAGAVARRTLLSP